MNGIFKRIWNLITGIIVVVLVALSIMFVGVRLLGITPYSVLSGSMEPTYHTGSLIYVKDVPAEEIQVGDPITFVMDEKLTVATHRVVEIDAETQHFTTKGDANDFIDAKPVHFNNLIGVPVFTIPKLGYFANYIQTAPGKYIALSGGAFLILLMFLPDLFAKEEEKEEGAKKSNKAKKPAKRAETVGKHDIGSKH